jgi:hypothetical protein
VSCIVFLGCFLDWMKCLRIEHHLVVKFGTFSVAGHYMSSLLWVDDLCLEEALFFLVFPVICYFHQIVMISVIKLCRVVVLADLHGVNV